MIHDRVATLASLARATLQCVDHSAIDTRVQTRTLVLLLEGLLALTEHPAGQRVDDGAVRSIREMVAEVETATKSRNDDAGRTAMRPEDPKTLERRRQSALLGPLMER